MKPVKWSKIEGVVDAETGKQLLQLVICNCTQKFRETAGRELVNKLNTIARNKEGTNVTGSR